MLTVDDLLPLISAFCEARGISEARLSNIIFNDGKRIRAIREKNSDISSRSLRDVFQWFSNNWPEGLRWPAGIDRPAPTSPEASAA